MAKTKKQTKPRAEKYEEKVHFGGTLEQMIQLAIKPVVKKDEKK